MKIKVTQEHIDQGQMKSPFYCPVAIALREHFWSSSVGASICVVKYKHPPVKLPIPLEVKEFVHSFDNMLGVKPFEFELCL